MPLQLVIEDEAGTRTVVPLGAAPLEVGRAPAAGWRLPDRNVSRRHARFLVSGGAAFVEDLGSANGTRVNGERISGRVRLREGDLVRIGDYDLAVREEGLAAAAGPPPLPGRAARPAATSPALAAVELRAAAAPARAAPLATGAEGDGARTRLSPLALAAALAALAAAAALAWLAR